MDRITRLIYIAAFHYDLSYADTLLQNKNLEVRELVSGIRNFPDLSIRGEMLEIETQFNKRNENKKTSKRGLLDEQLVSSEDISTALEKLFEREAKEKSIFSFSWPSMYSAPAFSISDSEKLLFSPGFGRLATECLCLRMQGAINDTLFDDFKIAIEKDLADYDAKNDFAEKLERYRVIHGFLNLEVYGLCIKRIPVLAPLYERIDAYVQANRPIVVPTVNR